MAEIVPPFDPGIAYSYESIARTLELRAKSVRALVAREGLTRLQLGGRVVRIPGSELARLVERAAARPSVRFGATAPKETP